MRNDSRHTAYDPRSVVAFYDDAGRVIEGLHSEGREVVITQQGKPTAVIVDLEKYLEMQDALAEFSAPTYLTELMAARGDIRSGRGVAAEEVFRQKGL